MYLTYGESQFTFVFILCFILVYLYFPHMRLQFVQYFRNLQVNSFKAAVYSCNFYVWSLRLGFVMELGILLYWVVLVFDHFILYVSFVMNCQKGRLFGSKSLEQLPNHEYKLLQIQILEFIGIIRQCSRGCKSEYKKRGSCRFKNSKHARFDRSKDGFCRI